MLERSVAEAVARKSAAVRSAPLAGVLGTRVAFQNSTNVLELTKSVLYGPAPTHLSEK